MAKHESDTARLDRESKEQGLLRPTETSGTLPGAPKEGRSDKTTGVGQTDHAAPDQESLMERLEARTGDDSGSGNLGQGIHVGTPAGGVTEAARTGSAHWGTARVQDEEDEQ